MDGPHPGGVGKLLADEVRELVLVLHRHDANDRRLFTETATGLDHVGFHVPTRAISRPGRPTSRRSAWLAAPAADEPGTQAPIADETYGSVLVFRDPDNIQLELVSPPGA